MCCLLDIVKLPYTAYSEARELWGAVRDLFKGLDAADIEAAIDDWLEGR